MLKDVKADIHRNDEAKSTTTGKRMTKEEKKTAGVKAEEKK
jgi:hypothetical protein